MTSDALLKPALISERVMVCMSSNALAPRVLRTGARIAGRLGAEWYAVYVETPRENFLGPSQSFRHFLGKSSY
jgi:K+-sensing histidine kinase KdpD